MVVDEEHRIHSSPEAWGVYGEYREAEGEGGRGGEGGEELETQEARDTGGEKERDEEIKPGTLLVVVMLHAFEKVLCCVILKIKRHFGCSPGSSSLV
jgi:hypothetical protein